MAKVMHNHLTRDIKPLGQCPKCDEHHQRQTPCECNVYASNGSGRVIAWRTWACPLHRAKD